MCVCVNKWVCSILEIQLICLFFRDLELEAVATKDIKVSEQVSVSKNYINTVVALLFHWCRVWFRGFGEAVRFRGPWDEQLLLMQAHTVPFELNWRVWAALCWVSFAVLKSLNEKPGPDVLWVVRCLCSSLCSYCWPARHHTIGPQTTINLLAFKTGVVFQHPSLTYGPDFYIKLTIVVVLVSVLCDQLKNSPSFAGKSLLWYFL